MNDGILLTDAAIEAAKERIEKLNIPTHVRVGVKGGNCAGYSYVIQFDHTEKKERDVEFWFAGISVYVDNKSLAFLKGTVIDYEKSLMSSGFVFHNPNAKKNCGCGASFDII